MKTNIEDISSVKKKLMIEIEAEEIDKRINEAYVKARYDRSYKITKEQLEYLAKRVKILQKLTERICKEKITNFTD